MTTIYPLGKGALAQVRLGDEQTTNSRPLSAALGLTCTISASQYSAALGLTCTIQRANVASLLLYCVIVPASAFAINGDGTIIAPDQITYTPRDVVGRTLSANPLLQGYASMTWNYSKLQLAEFTQLLSYYNPLSPVVLVTSPDENGNWIQQQLVMHPPTYGSQSTVIMNNVALTFTRMFS
jgi:hypothetical protein